jgi:hypothetical protein
MLTRSSLRRFDHSSQVVDFTDADFFLILGFSDWISLIRRIRVIRGAEDQSGLLFNHKTGARDGFQRKRDTPHVAKFTLIRSTEFSPSRTGFVAELEISRLNETHW